MVKFFVRLGDWVLISIFEAVLRAAGEILNGQSFIPISLSLSKYHPFPYGLLGNPSRAPTFYEPKGAKEIYPNEGHYEGLRASNIEA